MENLQCFLLRDILVEHEILCPSADSKVMFLIGDSLTETLL
jgi:hypothetical protein